MVYKYADWQHNRIVTNERNGNTVDSSLPDIGKGENMSFFWPGNRNKQLPNIYDRGTMADIVKYFYQDGELLNFMISGFADKKMPECYELFDEVREYAIAQYPVLTLYRDNSQENILEFEPFYGMTDIQIITSVRQLAIALDYTVMPKLERVIRAHMQILKELDMSVTLTGFCYLNTYTDIEEFHDNIMALPCGEKKAAGIWADLGVDDTSDNNQFDLFRSVIDNFAQEMQENGWNRVGEADDHNCLMAIKHKESITLYINEIHSDLLFTYLAEELKACGNREYALLIDDLQINSENFISYLCTVKENCHIGITSKNIVSQLGKDNFLELCEKMDNFVFFKHGTAKTAEIFAELMGCSDYMKVETSQKYTRRAFDLFYHDRQDDIRYSTENRYRVMPEDIMELGLEQAIIFDTVIDEIIYFN